MVLLKVEFVIKNKIVCFKKLKCFFGRISYMGSAFHTFGWSDSLDNTLTHSMMLPEKVLILKALSYYSVPRERWFHCNYTPASDSHRKSPSNP